MRFYTEQHSFYCGIDLHARTMYVCILSADGETVLERNIPTSPERFLCHRVRLASRLVIE